MQPPVPMGKVTAPVEGGNLRRGPYYSFSSSSGRRMLFLAIILKKMLGLSRMSLAAISTTAIPLTSHLSSPAS